MLVLQADGLKPVGSGACGQGLLGHWVVRFSRFVVSMCVRVCASVCVCVFLCLRARLRVWHGKFQASGVRLLG